MKLIISHILCISQFNAHIPPSTSSLFLQFRVAFLFSSILRSSMHYAFIYPPFSFLSTLSKAINLLNRTNSITAKCTQRANALLEKECVFYRFATISLPCFSCKHFVCHIHHSKCCTLSRLEVMLFHSS